MAAPDPSAPARIDVILWFDTEDYLLPASDDAAKRLAELLTERGIRATFKVVGEKARTLERRGRKDVIAALQHHNIAYHSAFHSVHPTPSEYLAECGLLDGIAEFVRREGPGAADVRRIFQVATLGCYGQPGSSWAAQTMAGLKEIGVAPAGVPCYVDEGTHVGLNEKPFWFEGALTVYHMGGNYTRMELHEEDAVGPAQKKFSEIANRLTKEDGGGLISIFYHPCEWVHRQFWDGVNFARGANPPREKWQAPPQRSPAETDSAFARFEQYIDYIRAQPGVHFVTAEDLPSLYPDRTRTEGVTQDELAEIVGPLTKQPAELGFIVIGSKSYSAADQFEVLVRALAKKLGQSNESYPIVLKGLLGPDSKPGAGREQNDIDPLAMRDTTRDVLNYVQSQKRIPARVFIGSEAIAPADFLVALAQAYAASDSAPPENIKAGQHVQLSTERYIAEDRPALFGGWIIHREGFRAPKILEVARLQAWTLKPALRKNS